MCAIQGTGGRRAPPAAPARTSRGSVRANFVSPRVCRRVKNRSWPIVRSARNFVPPFKERVARAGESDGGSVVSGTVPRPLFFCLRVRCRGQGEGVRRIGSNANSEHHWRAGTYAFAYDCACSYYIRVLFAVSFEGLPGLVDAPTSARIDAAFVPPALSRQKLLAVRAPHRTGSASHDPRRVGLDLCCQVTRLGF